mgnify:CR=1 FL=1
MSKSIDVKSLLIGSLLVLFVMCLLGTTPRLAPADPVGRFIIVTSSVSDNAVYVLDTVTGQVWPRYQQGGTGVFLAPKLKPQVPEETGEPRVP